MKIKVSFIGEKGDELKDETIAGYTILAEGITNYSFQTPRDVTDDGNGGRKLTGIAHLQLYVTVDTNEGGSIAFQEKGK